MTAAAVYTQSLIESIQSPTNDSDVTHVVCRCDDNLSFCGLDVSEIRWGRTPTECIVCADLDTGDFCDRCRE